MAPASTRLRIAGGGEMPTVPSTRTTSFGGYNGPTGRSFVLPDRSRKLDTRAGFFSPSLDGGLPLFELFNPSRRSSSAIWALSAATSAISSSRDGSASDSAVEKILHGCLREKMQPNLASYDYWRIAQNAKPRGKRHPTTRFFVGAF